MISFKLYNVKEWGRTYNRQFWGLSSMGFSICPSLVHTFAYRVFRLKESSSTRVYISTAPMQEPWLYDIAAPSVVRPSGKGVINSMFNGSGDVCGVGMGIARQSIDSNKYWNQRICNSRYYPSSAANLRPATREKAWGREQRSFQTLICSSNKVMMARIRMNCRKRKAEVQFVRVSPWRTTRRNCRQLAPVAFRNNDPNGEEWDARYCWRAYHRMLSP